MSPRLWVIFSNDSVNFASFCLLHLGIPIYYLSVNLLSISYGITLGWPSPVLLLITSDESPLPSGKVTLESASWVASLLGIGALIGNLVFGFVINKFGRKLPLQLLAIPTFVRNFLFNSFETVKMINFTFR